MNTLRKELRPDFATAEKLYPLVLKRLEDFKAFCEAQSEDTPKEVFDKEYKAMEQYLSELTSKVQRKFMMDMFYAHQYFYKFLALNCPHFDPTVLNTTEYKNGKYLQPTVEGVMEKIWR